MLRALLQLCFVFLFVTGCEPKLDDTATSLDDGAVCLSDSECNSGNCECEDFECLMRVCAPNNCVCGYGTSGSCDEPMTGGYDPEDCDVGNEVCGEDIGDCTTE